MDVVLAVVVLALFNTWWLRAHAGVLRERYDVRPPLFVAAFMGTGSIFVMALREEKRQLALASVGAISIGSLSASIDALTMKLPFSLTRLLLAEVTVFGLLESNGQTWTDAVVGGFLWANLLLFGHIVAGVGYGDVLFGLALGFWLGLSGLSVSLLGLILLSPLLATRLLLRRSTQKNRFAFGPYLFVAALLAWMELRS